MAIGNDINLEESFLTKSVKFFEEFSVEYKTTQAALLEEASSSTDALSEIASKLDTMIDGQAEAATATAIPSGYSGAGMDIMSKVMNNNSDTLEKLTKSISGMKPSTISAPNVPVPVGYSGIDIVEELAKFNKTGNKLNVRISGMSGEVATQLSSTLYGTSSIYEKLLTDLTKSQNRSFKQALSANLQTLSDDIVQGGVAAAKPSREKELSEKTEKLKGSGIAVASSKSDEKEIAKLLSSKLKDVDDTAVVEKMASTMANAATKSDIDGLMSNTVTDVTQSSVDKSMRSIDSSLGGTGMAKALVKMIPVLNKATALYKDFKGTNTKINRQASASKQLITKAIGSKDSKTSSEFLNKALGLGQGKVTKRAALATGAAQKAVSMGAMAAKSLNVGMIIMQVVKEIPGLIVSSIAEIAALPFKMGIAFAVVAPLITGAMTGAIKEVADQYDTQLGKALGPLYTSNQEKEELRLAKAINNEATEMAANKEFADKKAELLASGVGKEEAAAQAKSHANRFALAMEETIGIASNMVEKTKSVNKVTSTFTGMGGSIPTVTTVMGHTEAEKLRISRMSRKALQELGTGADQEKIIELLADLLAESKKQSGDNKKHSDDLVEGIGNQTKAIEASSSSAPPANPGVVNPGGNPGIAPSQFK